MTRYDPKEDQGRDIALAIAQNEDTDVTVQDVKGMHEWDIYEWIEAWGYEWDGNEWVLEDEEE